MTGAAFPILLTFDLDAEPAILARDPEDAHRPVTLSRGRYGAQRGLPRLLALLRQEQIAATFFVPGWVVEQCPAAIETIFQDGHELAHHGYHHVPPASQSLDEAELAGLAREDGACFVLTMHPQLIGRASRVLLLERLIAFARSLGPVEFLRCRELTERVRGQVDAGTDHVRRD